MENTKGAVRQMTMVERMARAMCAEITGRDAYSELTTTKATLDRMALAALRELREPAELMRDAAHRVRDDGKSTRTMLRAAIDAIIAEHEAA